MDLFPYIRNGLTSLLDVAEIAVWSSAWSRNFVTPLKAALGDKLAGKISTYMDQGSCVYSEVLADLTKPYEKVDPSAIIVDDDAAKLTGWPQNQALVVTHMDQEAHARHVFSVLRSRVTDGVFPEDSCVTLAKPPGVFKHYTNKKRRLVGPS